MRRFNKLSLIVSVLLIGSTGCLKKEAVADTNNSQKVQVKEIKAEELSYRNKSLSSEDGVAEAIPNADYGKDVAGTSKKIDRAFDNAPPMIPHDVADMLPITKTSNMCLDCHMPEIAPTVGATSIPKTHFTNFRPKVEYKNGNFAREVDDQAGKVVKHELGELYQGRFNCTQCHAPQAVADPLVENKFQGAFRNNTGKASSNLMNTINEGVVAE